MNKKAQELAMHEKDTGSSEVQIALLTEKIETLSTHIKPVSYTHLTLPTRLSV